MAHEDLMREQEETNPRYHAIGNYYLRKEAQDPALKQNYETAFALDRV